MQNFKTMAVENNFSMKISMILGGGFQNPKGHIVFLDRVKHWAKKTIPRSTIGLQ